MNDPTPFGELDPHPDMETLRREWRQWDEWRRAREARVAKLRAQSRAAVELVKREEALMARRPFWPF